MCWNLVPFVGVVDAEVGRRGKLLGEPSDKTCTGDLAFFPAKAAGGPAARAEEGDGCARDGYKLVLLAM